MSLKLSKKAFTSGMASVSLACAISLIPTASFAVSDPVGDWGFMGRSKGYQLKTGHKANLRPQLTCNPSPSIQPSPDVTDCSYTPSMHFVITAVNDAVILNNRTPGEDTFPLQSASLITGVINPNVGTCTVLNDRKVDCKVDSSGMLKRFEFLAPKNDIVGFPSIYTCTPSFHATWWNESGEPQRAPINDSGTDGNNDAFGRNDFFTYTTGQLCEQRD